MAPVALAFAVLSLSGRSADLGIVLAARSVPLVGFLLAGGAAGDRFRRSTVLQLSNAGAGLTQGIVAAMLLTGHASIPAIAALEFLNGTIAAFTLPATRGIVPQLVSAEHRQRANSLVGSSQHAIAVIGPAIAGLVVATIGGGWALAADAASFLAAAACMRRLDLPAVRSQGQPSLLHDIREGWREFRGLTWVVVSVASFLITNCIYVGIWTVLGPTIAASSIGATGWGIALSAKAAGVLLLSVVMYRVEVRHLLAAGQLCAAAEAVPLIMLGLHPSLLLLASAAFIAGAGTGVFGVAWETSLQEHVPHDKLSRVSAYDDVGSFVAVPVGQVSAGPAAAAFGAAQVSVAGGVLYGIVAASPLLLPAVRHLTQPRRGAARRESVREPARSSDAAGHP